MPLAAWIGTRRRGAGTLVLVAFLSNLFIPLANPKSKDVFVHQFHSSSHYSTFDFDASNSLARLFAKLIHFDALGAPLRSGCPPEPVHNGNWWLCAARDC